MVKHPALHPSPSTYDVSSMEHFRVKVQREKTDLEAEMSWANLFWFMAGRELRTLLSYQEAEND
jgi:hypothetical protein